MTPVSVTLSVTLAGDREAVERSIGQILDIVGGQVQGANAPMPVVVTTSPPDDQLLNFVRSLAPSCRQAVQLVAERSASGGMLRRSELWNTVTIDGEPLDYSRIDGVTGTIGKRWKRWSRSPNPFLGKPDAATGEIWYSVSQELADQLLAALSHVEAR